MKAARFGCILAGITGDYDITNGLTSPGIHI